MIDTNKGIIKYNLILAEHGEYVPLRILIYSHRYCFRKGYEELTNRYNKILNEYG